MNRKDETPGGVQGLPFDPQSLVPHDIYASNFFLGKSLFFSLKLPARWQLAPGVSRPEIAAAHTRRNKKWVVSGDAWYVVHDRERGWALEMAASIRPVLKYQPPPTGEPVSVSGHPAQLSWKEKRRGLPWQRHTVTFMTLSFDCQPSDRHIKLEFSGWCPREGFREILQSLRHLKCH